MTAIATTRRRLQWKQIPAGFAVASGFRQIDRDDAVRELGRSKFLFFLTNTLSVHDDRDVVLLLMDSLSCAIPEIESGQSKDRTGKFRI